MSSNKIDIHVIGASAVQPYRVAASATRFYAGEPVNFASFTYTSGVSDVNTITQAADATPVIDAAGTNAAFVGIAAQRAEVNNAGTVTASVANVTEVLPNFTRMRGKSTTSTNCDTLSELIGLLFDYAIWDLTSGLFTIDVATTDTAGLTVKGGIWEQSLLEVTVDPRALRTDITT